VGRKEVASAFTTVIAAVLLLVGRKRPSTAAAPTARRERRLDITPLLVHSRPERLVQN
jgi:hypothetical protein